MQEKTIDLGQIFFQRTLYVIGTFSTGSLLTFDAIQPMLEKNIRQVYNVENSSQITCFPLQLCTKIMLYTRIVD